MLNALDILVENVPGLDLNQKSPIEINWTRKELATFFHLCAFKIGAEIGIERAVYSRCLLEQNPDLFLYMIDPWMNYAGYRDHVSREKFEEMYVESVQQVKPFSHQIIRQTSVQASTLITNGSLDFVYIDGNHDFLNVTQDLHYWTPKVKTGGVIAGHDFTRRKGNYINHVKDVIQAWTYSHGIKPWFVCKGDKSPSWFWIKTKG